MSAFTPIANHRSTMVTINPYISDAFSLMYRGESCRSFVHAAVQCHRERNCLGFYYNGTDMSCLACVCPVNPSVVFNRYSLMVQAAFHVIHMPWLTRGTQTHRMSTTATYITAFVIWGKCTQMFFSAQTFVSFGCHTCFKCIYWNIFVIAILMLPLSPSPNNSTANGWDSSIGTSGFYLVSSQWEQLLLLVELGLHFIWTELIRMWISVHTTQFASTQWRCGWSWKGNLKA